MLAQWFASTILARFGYQSRQERDWLGTTKTVKSRFSNGRVRLSAPFWAGNCQSPIWLVSAASSSVIGSRLGFDINSSSAGQETAEGFVGK
jgi:hypothetical protein